MASQPKPVVVLTGASRGIGLATCRILLEELNANVLTISRTRSPELQSLLDKHGSHLTVVEADITDEPAVREAIQLALRTYQRIDGLILNAGVLEPVRRISSPESTTESWRKHFDVNFFSLLYCTQAALPALRDSKGRIIFVSSGAAVNSTPAMAVYNAGKAAMNSFCRTLANEEKDVVAVALRPGMVDTSMQDTMRSSGAEHMRKEDLERFMQAHADGTLVKPEDSGYVIATLSLRAPESLSGQFVNWNGDECRAFRRGFKELDV